MYSDTDAGEADRDPGQAVETPTSLMTRHTSSHTLKCVACTARLNWFVVYAVIQFLQIDVFVHV